MSRLFDLDVQLLHDSLLVAIAVFALFFALSYLLFEPAKKLLEDRREKIAEDLKGAESSRTQAEKLQAAYEQKLGNVREEAGQILEEARRTGIANRERILRKARQEAQQILQRAKAEADLERSRMEDEVRREILSVAAALAARAVTACMDASLQDRLLEETLKEMKKSTWQT